MTEVLLKELNNSDINWMIATGHRKEIAAGTVVVRSGKAVDALHIVLDGTLAVTLSQADDNPLARAFAAIEGSENSVREIARLSSGEVVGEIPFVSVSPTSTTVKALENSLLMSIPQQQLAAKLQQDAGFASRFYRAIAILLLDRLESMVSQLSRNKLIPNQSLKDVLFILGELYDSDIDWIVDNGSRQEIVAGTVLVHAGRPVDALHILLDGIVTVTVSNDDRNPLTRAFNALDGSETSDREMTRLSRGEIVGETPFIDARLPITSVKAIKDSLVLSIPRQRLAAKLQQDVGFASRFYRVIATLLSSRLQGMLSQLGYGRRVYSKGQSLDETVKYEDELDSSVLDRMALAGNRFDWLLRRIGSIT